MAPAPAGAWWLLLSVPLLSLAGLAPTDSPSPSPSLPWCVQSVADISVERPGRWANGSYAHPGYFARSPNQAEWMAQACPVQQRAFSCYRHPEVWPRARAAEHRHFVPDGCALRPFDPLVFLEAITGRHLFFCCDSLSEQFFVAVVCSLHGATTVSYRIKWEALQWKYGAETCPLQSGELCHLSAATAYYPEYNASIAVKGTHLHRLGNKKHATNAPREYFAKGNLHSPRDVLLLNFGLHIHTPHEFRALLQAFVAKYTALPPATRPFLLWVEGSPQHFNASGSATGEAAMGEWRPNLPGLCSPYADVLEAHKADFKNRFAEQLCSAHNVPLLRVAAASVWQWDAHIGLRRSEGRYVYDCTHFCQPSGVFFHWRELLLNALAVLP